MSKSFSSKFFAIAFTALTVSVIGSIITVTILFNSEIALLDPTYRPTDPSTTVGPPPDMRLPWTLIPDSYRVFLQPHLYDPGMQMNDTSFNQTMLFTGNTTIHFHCVQRTRSIYLHSRKLDLFSSVVKNRDTYELINIISVRPHESKADFLEIELRDFLEAGGNYSLFLVFSGQMSDNIQGLYISRYSEGLPEDGGGNHERTLAATSLEPTNARSVFPCFDEPQMKAVFNVTIIHRKNFNAIGNADIQESYGLENGWKYTRFYRTPKMSSYLFAFMVSEIPSVKSTKRKTFQIFARQHALDAGYTQYAATVTEDILSFYEKILEIKYPLNKLDQVALPDLLAEAVASWGLITYKEEALLYEEGVSSQLQREDIKYLVAHELAQQWFGSLVTMKWWNELWLKEGFATYMAYLVLDQKNLFVTRDLHRVFGMDALSCVHPLTVSPGDIQTTNQITTLYDPITYYKGAMVLRMLADSEGESIFHKGIQMYLRAFQYGNANQSDLWEQMQEAVNEDSYTEVATVMDTWTNQIGYPVININTENGEVYQRHFMYNYTANTDLWWHVPIRYMSNTSAPSLFWLRTSNKVIKDELISKKGEWILANINRTGYYRVNYDLENWKRLQTQLDTDLYSIPEMNRGQLVDDAFNLARAKLVDVKLALNLTWFLRHEKAYLPWESAIRNLEYFVLMFDRSELFGPMQMFLRNLVRDNFNDFMNQTGNSTEPSCQYLQIASIDVACSNGCPNCIKMASTMFADWMNSNGTTGIPPNLRSVIFCHALAAGGEKEWEFAWDKFLTTKESSERKQLREGLSCTKKIWLLSRYLEYTLDPDKVRLGEVTSTIISIARNVAGQALAWNFIRAHWEHVRQGDEAALVAGVTRRFSTPFELDELEQFASNYKLGRGVAAIEQAIEQTRVNIQWVSENKEIIMEWLETSAFYENI